MTVKRRRGQAERCMTIFPNQYHCFPSPDSCFLESLRHIYYKFHRSPFTRWLMGWFIHSKKLSLASINKYRVPLRFNNNIIIPPSLDTSSKSLEKVIYSQKPQLVTSAPIIAKKIQPRTLQALSMIAEMSDSEYAIKQRGTYCCACTVWGVPRSFHMHVKN